MGTASSRFGKKTSAREALEKLENEIKETEENKSYMEIQQKRITKLVYFNTMGLCLICCLVFYFQFSSSLSLREKFQYLVPLALSPFLLLIINMLITWYYAWEIKKKLLQLVEMKKEKKRILEEVMDKETYKVAKEILDKFSTETIPKPSLQSLQLVTPDFRKRTSNQVCANPNLQNPVLFGKNSNAIQQDSKQAQGSLVPESVQGRVPIRQLPASIFPINRSYVDKLFEYLIGDGPNNRYALICSQCHSHNGMALKEEFEYTGFKCCYCFFYNPARKQRPEAPKLEDFNFKYRNNSDLESTSSEDQNEKCEAEILKGDEPNDEANCSKTE